MPESTEGVDPGQVTAMDYEYAADSIEKQDETVAKGLIPWDDDIDIVMPRKDYDKLAEIINKGNYSLRFIDIKYNPDTIYILMNFMSYSR